MEYRETSFLADIFGDIYEFLRALKPGILIYTSVLALAFVLSMFFQSSIIQFFIDSLMGWTLLPVSFVAVLIVSLDKKIKMPQKDDWEAESAAPNAYKYSIAWGIFLVIAGFVALYCSNEYKKYYAFQCEDFYLEMPQGVYHLRHNCDNIGIDSEDESEVSNSLDKVRGAEISDAGYELCAACEQWAEDVEMEYEAERYYRP